MVAQILINTYRGGDKSMDAAQFLPTEPSPEGTQIHVGDYKDAD